MEAAPKEERGQSDSGVGSQNFPEAVRAEVRTAELDCLRGARVGCLPSLRRRKHIPAIGQISRYSHPNPSPLGPTPPAQVP